MRQQDGQRRIAAERLHLARRAVDEEEIDLLGERLQSRAEVVPLKRPVADLDFDERRLHQLDAVGEAGLLEHLGRMPRMLRVVLDRDDASGAVGAERRREKHGGAAGAELHDELRPVAADEVEEERRLLAGDLETLMREGRDRALDVELRQDGDHVDQRGKAGLQPLFCAVVARAHDAAERDDVVLDLGQPLVDRASPGAESRRCRRQGRASRRSAAAPHIRPKASLPS